MGQILNLQETAASLYETILSLNKTATQMIGLDALWCRLLLYDNGEDVIVQEYTLHQYECPKDIKIVSNNSSYNVGNFAIDLFGIKNAETLEIGIDVETWKSVYGPDSCPQKGDFVLIPLLHRPYEVVSSTAVHTIGEKITSWKCVLGEWKHAASRKETEDFQISIDELTVSQDRLFGDAISKEVADAVNDVETAYNTTTYVDPFKNFDMKSIEVETVYGESANIITNAYYNFAKAKQPVIYKVDAVFDPTVNENKWIYSSWFKCNNTNSASGTVKLKLQTKDNEFWYFNIVSQLKLSYEEEISISRGTMINLNGKIDKDGCSDGWILKVPTSDCLKTNKRFPKFWESGIWKIKRKTEYNLFTGYKNGKIVFKIDITSDKGLNFKCGDFYKQIFLDKLDLNVWNYIALEIQQSSLRIIVLGLHENADQGMYIKDVIDEKIPINIKTFSFDQATINNAGLSFNMTNIRLFENEYELGNAYKYDMYSQVVRNASKLIVVDTPKAPNDMTFVSPIR